MKILSIESSCDETGAAIVEGAGDHIKVLSNVVGSQIKLHRNYGGVVPELAARQHSEMIISVVHQALQKGLQFSQLNQFSSKIDAIAVTNTPGLMIALLVGIEAAKSLAYAWDKPLIGVNHLEGHIYSVLGDPAKRIDASFFNFSCLALIVSGGSTALVIIKRIGKYQLLGRTRDDAAGEAFDKVAKILDLPYPGGPSISKAAFKGVPGKYVMPRPMLDSPDFDFSFAGIKTHVVNLVRSLGKKHWSNEVPSIACAFQEAVTDVLVAKTIAAALKYNIKKVIVTGGVSANQRLREKMQEAARYEKLICLFPPMNLTGDNAAMIGIAGYLKARYNIVNELYTIQADPNLKF